ncbi:hypothetical protein RHMOL_Rhmol12G0216700 [Rhododendron molle]|uniref:Uncharacterized protein n=1 Tax=Rhododendron molle TaxID=49168 RepID=A0ACC0LKQ5_RHOML|nr:hypothetical protein RHMOL_Rhmol12G0216700 [Rhododendron molle]
MEKRQITYPVNLEELKDAQNDVVNIAEPRGLRLLRMMQPPGPIERHIRVLSVQLDRGPYGTPGGGLAEGEEAVEDRAVLADVEPLERAHHHHHPTTFDSSTLIKYPSLFTEGRRGPWPYTNVVAVVGDLDEFEAVVLDDDGGGANVEAVLDQLLHGGD